MLAWPPCIELPPKGALRPTRAMRIFILPLSAALANWLERWQASSIPDAADDQVATDMRLWVLGAIQRANAVVHELQDAPLTQAEAAGDALIPGYTHMQRRPAYLLSHWLLSYFWPLA